MARRPKLGTSKMGAQWLDSNNACRLATLNSIASTSASEPNVPMLLSFMIARRRSVVYPPPIPSVKSARPSRCRPRVKMTKRVVRTTAESNAGIHGCIAIATIMLQIPTMRPTRGKNEKLPAKSAETADRVRPWGTGNTVRKLTAVANCLIKFFNEV